MVTINRVERHGSMELWDIVKFQMKLYCHFNKVYISESDIELMALLAINGETDFTQFCNAACDPDKRDKDYAFKYEREVFNTPQSTRNSVNKLLNLNLIVREGKRGKILKVNPLLQIQSEGNIFVEIKFLRKDESKKV